MALLKVLRQMARQRLFVERYENPSFPLRPDKNVRISGSPWQVRWTADTNRVERERASAVVLLDGLPQNAAQVLIQDITENGRHGGVPNPFSCQRRRNSSILGPFR